MIIPTGTIASPLYLADQVMFDASAAAPMVAFPGEHIMQWRIGTRYLHENPQLATTGVFSALHTQADGLEEFLQDRLSRGSLVYSANGFGAFGKVMDKTRAFRDEMRKEGNTELFKLCDREMDLLRILFEGTPVRMADGYMNLHGDLRSVDEDVNQAPLSRHNIDFITSWIQENSLGRETYAVTPKYPIVRVARTFCKRANHDLYSLMSQVPYDTESKAVLQPAA